MTFRRGNPPFANLQPSPTLIHCEVSQRVLSRCFQFYIWNSHSSSQLLPFSSIASPCLQLPLQGHIQNLSIINPSPHPDLTAASGSANHPLLRTSELCWAVTSRPHHTSPFLQINEPSSFTANRSQYCTSISTCHCFIGFL